jgi:hypothetical protein
MKAKIRRFAVTVFFFTYAAFELPSNLVLKRLRPSIWLPIIMIGVGIVMVRKFLKSLSLLVPSVDRSLARH